MSKNEESYLESKLEKLNDNIIVDEEFQHQTNYKFKQKMNEAHPRKSRHSWVIRAGLPVAATLLFISFVSVLLLSNMNTSTLDNNSNSLPKEFELSYQPIDFMVYEETEEIEFQDLHGEALEYEIDGEPLYVVRFFDYENGEYNGLRGILKYKGKSYDLGIISTDNQTQTSEEARMFKMDFSENGEIQFIGTIGSWRDGYKYLFYNNKNNTFFGFHHMGEADHFDWDKDGLDEVYISTSGRGETKKDIEVVRWNNDRLEKASFNESVAKGNLNENMIGTYFIHDNIVGVNFATETEIKQQIYGLDVTESTFKIYANIDYLPVFAEIMWNVRVYIVTGQTVFENWVGDEIGELTRDATEGKLEQNGDVAIRKHEFPELVGTNIHMVNKLDMEIAIAIQIEEHYYYAFAFND